jgi:ribosomal protein S18 acetylase RimI-like enzyme
MMKEADEHPASPTPMVLRGQGVTCRVREWPSQPRVAHLVLYQQARLPSPDDLKRWCDELAASGFQAARTSALSRTAGVRVASVGFSPVQELVLLQHDEPRAAPSTSVSTSRLLVGDHAMASRVDHAAFGPGWSLDPDAIADVCHATPRHRGRHAGGNPLQAYAITGRDSRQGFLQRLAVDPMHQRQGLGRALVIDSLRWLARWRVGRVLVNTPTTNDGALALYESLGFRQLRDRLSVYERSLT